MIREATERGGRNEAQKGQRVALFRDVLKKWRDFFSKKRVVKGNLLLSERIIWKLSRKRRGCTISKIVEIKGRSPIFG